MVHMKQETKEKFKTFAKKRWVKKTTNVAKILAVSTMLVWGGIELTSTSVRGITAKEIATTVKKQTKKVIEKFKDLIEEDSKPVKVRDAGEKKPNGLEIVD